jgi:hypothetical protein
LFQKCFVQKQGDEETQNKLFLKFSSAFV